MRDDLATWLPNRPHRAYEASVLRSLFGTLNAERLIFSNPMRGIKRGRWPNSTNPHLLSSRNTATTTTAVATFWVDKLVRPLPVGLDRLRQGRILEEALAGGADPLHLAHVFCLGAKTSLRYTTAVAAAAAEKEPRAC
ncbi:hypothetical protein [Streptomyces sp. MST-110588]|uniref:hypothetical protein n=1 Tax=Streptomyces sp. MST-110588 TaxID=2833628 RepID=UPI001F5C555B|nr:hypothetical protein [Streptomyces sp. MST-110588]UNO43173.1 hypothetical protein KGS77_31365 [Streptomyces sp. MST-110588]